MWRSILAGIWAITPQMACAVQPALIPGALASDCRSVLQIGIVSCDRPEIVAIGSEERPRKEIGQSPGSISEAQVDEFLAQYGKPPREAVRALLDPSDANIAAWLTQQRRVVAIAGYVANRITRMQGKLDIDPRWRTLLPLPELTAMIQMRATLYIKPGDPASLKAAEALQRLVAHYPAVDGELAQVGLPSTPKLSSWLAGLDTVLPLSILPADVIGDASLPVILIEDLRTGRHRQFDAAGVTPQRIRDEMVALRATEQTVDHASKSFSPIP